MPLVSGTYSQSITWTGATVTADGAHSSTDPTTVDNAGTRSLGMDISDCTGWRVIVSADSGDTLTSVTVRIWLWSNLLTRWVHDSQLDYTPTITAATYRDDVSPDFPAYLGYGAVYVQLVNPVSSNTAHKATPQVEGGVLK